MWITQRGVDTRCFVKNGFFIFFNVKENARVPLNPARPVCGRTRRNSSRLRQGYGAAQTVAASFSPADGMLSAGQREIKKPKA